VASLVLRYRRSRGEEREQIKWIAFAASVIGLLFLIGLVISLIYGSTPPSWTRLLDTMTALSYTGVPIAVGFAVLKYRLYDIEVIINRTLVYGSLTLLLALVYFGGITATQAIFRTLSGQEQQPQLAIVVSTLVIAALFNPLRRRIQAFIDRRFYRKKYDAAKTLEAFTARLRDETDLQALNGELTRVVRETMQPSHVSLWLRPDPPPRASEGREQVS
jgi:fumarate reductase subunit D